MQAISFAPPARAGAGEWSCTTLVSFTKRVRSCECYASLGSEGTSRTCNEQRVTTAPACHMPTSENGDGLVRRLRLSVSIFKERGTHVSRLGFGARIRTWIARFRVSSPTN